jgi:replicative DNA helicase
MGQEESWDELRKEGQGTWERFADSGYLHAPDPVPLGVKDLDVVLGGGLRPGLSVLGGEPGAGKSALGLQSALFSAWAGHRVLYVSLEMDVRQCTTRAASCLSALGVIPGLRPFAWAKAHEHARESRERVAEAVRNGDAESEMVAMATGGDPVITAVRALYEQVQGFMVHGGQKAGTERGLMDLARRSCAAGARLIVVDYLQLVQPGDGKGGALAEYERVTSASRTLNAIGR